MGKSARDRWLGVELVSKTGRKCRITEYNGYVKIGITHQTPEGRIRQIHKSTRSMFLFECYKSWNMIGKDAVFCEHEILTLLRQQYKQPSETFDGSSETFVGTSPSEVAILIEKFLEENNIELLV